MNITNLKTKSNKEFDLKKIIIDEYEILVDRKFKESKIRFLINEFAEKSEHAEQEGLTFNPQDYMFILMLKYFTDVKIPDSYDMQVQMLSLLIDLGYFEQIIDNFDQSEVNKITDIILNMVNNTKLVIDKLKEVDMLAKR